MTSSVILRKSGTYTPKQIAEKALPVKDKGFFFPSSWNVSEVKKYAGKALRTAFKEAQALKWANPPAGLIRAHSAFTQ